MDANPGLRNNASAWAIMLSAFQAFDSASRWEIGARPRNSRFIFNALQVNYERVTN